MRFTICVFLWVLGVSLCEAINITEAGEFNPKWNIGDVAPKWEALVGVDDKEHASADLQGKSAVVVVFTCNSCPYAVDLEDRLIALHKQFAAKGVALVAINVNTIESDALPAMKEKANAKGFAFPYLFDATQQIGKAFGAGYTPECFVLDSDHKITYMGSFDDSPDGRDIKQHYVRDAVNAVLSGEPLEVTETVPIGCRIRYERTRRTREAADR